jgi:hypothetical protein
VRDFAADQAVAINVPVAAPAPVAIAAFDRRLRNTFALNGALSEFLYMMRKAFHR